MRRTLLTTLSLMLFAVVVSQSSTAFAQRRTCALGLKVIEPSKAETDEVHPITGARAIATKLGSRETIQAVVVEGQPIFPELTDGDYKLTITKRGYMRTVQQITFMCFAPSQDTLIHIKLARGSSKLTVTNEKLTVKAGLVVWGNNEISAGPERPPETIDKPPSSSSTPIISGGVLNGRAVSLPRPPYPAIARSAGASGTVTVRVMIDEEGNVISAWAVSGHPLLREASVTAARAAKFTPTRLAGQPVKVSGVINYNFTLKPPEEPKAVTE